MNTDRAAGVKVTVVGAVEHTEKLTHEKKHGRSDGLLAFGSKKKGSRVETFRGGGTNRPVDRPTKSRQRAPWVGNG